MKASYMFMSDPRANDGTVMDWVECLAELKQNGLDGVDVFARQLAKMGLATDAFMARIRDMGLVPAVYCIHTDFISPGADVQASLDAVRAGAEVCVKHGIGHLFSAGGQHTNSGPAAMDRYVAGLQQALEITRQAGLALSIENAGQMCHTWQSLLECVERVGPDMKVTLDGGNFILAGSDAIEAAEHLGPRVVHVHVKNFVPDPDHRPYPYRYCPPDQGITDYRRLVTILGQAGFDGFLAFEPEGWPDAPAPQGVRYCAQLASMAASSG